MITTTDAIRANQVFTRLQELETERSSLCLELERIQERCKHPRLPVRKFGEEYRDICPDCYYVVYCYSQG